MTDIAAKLDQVTGMAWAVKTTFLQYLTRTPGSQIAVTAGVEYSPQGEFCFPAAARSGAADSVAFDGAIRFIGHGGMLDLLLAEPMVHLSGSGGSLSVVDIDVDREGADSQVPRIAIADLEPATEPADLVTFVARLTEAGAELFNGVYEAGEQLAPVRLQLGPAERAG